MCLSCRHVCLGVTQVLAHSREATQDRPLALFAGLLALFVLVSSAVHSGNADAFIVMVSRICGILGGVLISLFLSVLIFPTSASQKATNGLDEGLKALIPLSRMAWGQEGKAAHVTTANGRWAAGHLYVQ